MWEKSIDHSIIQQILNHLEIAITPESNLIDVRQAIKEIFKTFELQEKIAIPQILDLIEEKPDYNIIAFSLRNHYRTHHLKGTYNKGNKKLKMISGDLFPRLSVSLNQQRGKLYEKVFGESLIQKYLSELYPGQSFTLERDKKVFVLKDKRGKVRRRRPDIYVKELDIVFEIKSGRVFFTREGTQPQIEMDRLLLEQKKIKRCMWFLFYGASANTLRALDNNGIEYFDFEFAFSEPDDQVEKKIIRV